MLVYVQASGRTMESFVHQHQDKSRNALNKAHEASFVAWVEELKADQSQFASEKLLNLSWVYVYVFCQKSVKWILEPSIFLHQRQFVS